MSIDEDGLRAMAANRGYKLVKSRRRKPGTGDYGRYGLKDVETGAECLGFGREGLVATPEEIETYLRGGAAADWKTSLKTAGAPPKAPGSRKAKPRAAEQPPAPPPPEPEPPQPEPEPEPQPEPEPSPPRQLPPLLVREARPRDAAAIAILVGSLGVVTSETDIARTLQRLRKADEPALVAEQEGIVGCLACHALPLLHRQKAVGRITFLAVDPDLRRRGIGRALLEAAQARLAQAGCDRIEAVADIGLGPAQDFFRRTGFERSAYRFTRPLGD